MRFLKVLIVWCCTYFLYIAMGHGLCNWQAYWQPFYNAAKNAAKYRHFNNAADLIVTLFTLLCLTLLGFFIANLPFQILRMERRNHAFFFFLLALVCALVATYLSYYTWLFLGDGNVDFNIGYCMNYVKYITNLFK